jgi:cell division protein FtsB
MGLHVASRIAWSVIGVVVVYMVFNTFYPQYQEYVKLQEREAALQTEYQLQEERLKLLKEYQILMESDAQFAEKIARENLGMVKPGETIIKFVD